MERWSRWPKLDGGQEGKKKKKGGKKEREADEKEGAQHTQSQERVKS
jgi:hypothetical protein